MPIQPYHRAVRNNWPICHGEMSSLIDVSEETDSGGSAWRVVIWLPQTGYPILYVLYVSYREIMNR